MKSTVLHAVVLLPICMGSPVTTLAELETSGALTQGVRQIDLNTNSSKFNEYRDLRDGFYLETVRFNARDPLKSIFLEFDGSNVLRDDQSLFLRLGDHGSRWNLTIDHRETPHRLSNKAMTPYIDRGDGLFTAPGRVAIIDDGFDSTGTPSLVPTTGQMAVNDALISEYLNSYLRPATLGTQRERTDISSNLSLPGSIKLHVDFMNENLTGSRSSYGPIGDRPPRTLNIQLSEPVNYTTREFQAGAEYGAEGAQASLNYQLSVFDNKIEDMRWENIFFTPETGEDFIVTRPGTARNVTTFGQRSLAPDNYAHTLSFASGLKMPWDSRLNATAVYGQMRQDEELLPYSVSTLGGDLNSERGDGLDWNDPAKLPRKTAEASMNTLRIDVDYTISPVRGLSLRPFARYSKLENETTTADWKYVTQGTAGTNGDVNYRNYRRNLAYAYDKLKLGIDARHHITAWRTTVGAGYARESIDRDFREADTDEDILELSLRTRPSRRLTLSAGYLHGIRNGDDYDYNVTSQSYWYSFDQGASDVDNPQFLFANHPDLRKYDVSDRTRGELKLGATFAAQAGLDLSGSYRLRSDDFDSEVQPIAPLTGTTVPLPNPDDANALTPGLQLGLLENKRQEFMVDANYAPSERWGIRAFGDREEITSDARGMVFNENQRREPSNPTIQTPTQLGPWTDADRLYTTRTEQFTNTLGLGVTYEIVPKKVRFLADYSLSRTTVDLLYDGYGSDEEYLGRDWETFQFGFDDPETARYNQYTVNATVEYQPFERLTFGFHYLFSSYRIQDWMQEPSGAWVEQVGSEYFLRDVTRDNRWGNRLVNMGSYLAPSYEGHVGMLSTTFLF